MKNLFTFLVEAIFNNDYKDDTTVKNLLIVALKVLVFILIITLGIWIATKLKTNN